MENTKNKNKEKPTYIGHRQRLKDRYKLAGINSLGEHEILELALFFALPRIDTKPLAYKLLKEFGSLADVIKASPDALEKAGLKQNTITLLKLIYDVPAWIADNAHRGKVLKSYDDIGKYLCMLHRESKTETLIALLLDSANRLIEPFTICTGNFSYASLEPRVLMKRCMSTGCEKVILSHNHPDKTIKPSEPDVNMTKNLRELLREFNIMLVEHYIVADDKYIGILKWQDEMAEERIIKEIMAKTGQPFENPLSKTKAKKKS